MGPARTRYLSRYFGAIQVAAARATRSASLDARVHLLKDASASVRHGDEVKFFTGASETIARLRLLGVEKLDPGKEGWIQLELRDPVVAVRGDRYILRRPSPGETIGGGVVVDHQPKGRHKRFDQEVLRSIESLSQGTPAEILMEAAMALQSAPVSEIVSRSPSLDLSQAEPALQELLLSGLLVPLEEGSPDIQSDLLVLALPHSSTSHDVHCLIDTTASSSQPSQQSLFFPR